MNIRRQMLRWRLRNGKLTEAAYRSSFSHQPATRQVTRVVLGQGRPRGRTYERTYHPTKGWRETRA